MKIATRAEMIRQQEKIRRYYQFQSMIYDSTRWSFLFGRKGVLDLIKDKKSIKHIMEVGCGTGYNIKNLVSAFPNTRITGVDVSVDMLSIAEKKFDHNPDVHLVEQAYTKGEITAFTPDLILFSYVLTMINPQYVDFIEQAYQDLDKGGKIVVVDFHSSRFGWFRRHMGNHHVRMDGHLDALLTSKFKTIHFEMKKAYGGVWNYFYFVGEK